jgi:hypothetical protein
MSRGRLVIIGSGETAPLLVEVHRVALAGPGSAVPIARLAEAAGAACTVEPASGWRAWMIDSSGRAHARRVLRAMVLELAGAAADGLADRRPVLEPLVTALLEQRTAAPAAPRLRRR